METWNTRQIKDFTGSTHPDRDYKAALLGYRKKQGRGFDKKRVYDEPYYDTSKVKALFIKKQKAKSKAEKRYKARPDLLTGNKSKYKGTISDIAYRKLRNAWYGMMRRCYTDDRPDYHHYREQGIKVCKEWLEDFDAFVEWSILHGALDKNRGKLSLDRIDNDGDYCPKNCRWTTKIVQANNSSWNRMVVYNDVLYTFRDFCQKIDVEYHYAYDWIYSKKKPLEKLVEIREKCGDDWERPFSKESV